MAGRAQEVQVEPERRWAIGLAVVLIAGITASHYLTDTHEVAFHNVYRRLYYVPILLASFSHGVRGGLAASLVTCLAYIPHAFFSAHRDPSPDVDKVLEMVLYIGIGGMTGWLVNRQKAVQRALERSLRERDALERELVRASKLTALGQMTSGLAHEIRNPLASILGAAEALVVEFGPEHRKHSLGQVLLKEINRLDRVVSDFLRFARPGRAELREVELGTLAREVINLTAGQRQGISLDFQAPDAPRNVHGDPGQLSQIVLNLLLNASQALDGQPEPRRIEVIFEARRIGGRAFECLGVRDNGPGVPEALREDIFNPYFTTRPEGTGLGLSISTRLAEEHGGFLELDNQPGQTTMWLCLPVERQDKEGA